MQNSTTASLFQLSGAVIDLIYRIDALPNAGSIEVAGEAMIAAGGGFNAMVAAQRAGATVVYAGMHGTGPLSDIVRTELARVNIPVLQARYPDHDQGSCVVLVDSAGERTFVSKPGAECFLEDAHLACVNPSDRDWLLVSGYSLFHQDRAALVVKWMNSVSRHTNLVFDPSPVIGKICNKAVESALTFSRWITANAQEARTITGVTDVEEAANGLVQMSGARCEGVVVRNGRAGAWICKRGGSPVQVPGFPVETIDTNGAGDTHVGAFIAGLLSGKDGVEAATFANAAAALSTTRFGPATAPAQYEVEAFLRT